MKKINMESDERTRELKNEDLERLRSYKGEVQGELSEYRKENPLDNYTYFLERKLRLIDRELRKQGVVN